MKKYIKETCILAAATAAIITMGCGGAAEGEASDADAEEAAALEAADAENADEPDTAAPDDGDGSEESPE